MFTAGQLRSHLKENSELLITEFIKYHRRPQELPRYLKVLLPQLHDIDQEFRNSVL